MDFFNNLKKISELKSENEELKNKISELNKIVVSQNETLLKSTQTNTKLMSENSSLTSELIKTKNDRDTAFARIKGVQSESASYYNSLCEERKKTGLILYEISELAETASEVKYDSFSKKAKSVFTGLIELAEKIKKGDNK